MFEVSALVLGRLQHLGDEGRSWLDGLGQLVTELESDWACRVGDPVDGGSAAFIANAVDRHGRPAILKVAIPAGGEGYANFEREALVLSRAESLSYVDVFEVDRQRLAFLLERLGSPLADLGLTVDNRSRSSPQPSNRVGVEYRKQPSYRPERIKRAGSASSSHDNGMSSESRAAARFATEHSSSLRTDLPRSILQRPFSSTRMLTLQMFSSTRRRLETGNDSR